MAKLKKKVPRSVKSRQHQSTLTWLSPSTNCRLSTKILGSLRRYTNRRVHSWASKDSMIRRKKSVSAMQISIFQRMWEKYTQLRNSTSVEGYLQTEKLSSVSQLSQFLEQILSELTLWVCLMVSLLRWKTSWASRLRHSRATNRQPQVASLKNNLNPVLN